MNLEELDWRKLRFGTTVRLLLEEGGERKFHFRNDQELSLALRLWNEQDEKARTLLQGNGIGRASSPKPEEPSRQTGL